MSTRGPAETATSRLRRAPAVMALAAACTVIGAVAPAHAQRATNAPAPRPFEVVLEQVVQGDLIVAANSNLLAGGGWADGSGWVPSADVTADIDGDDTPFCVNGASQTVLCADNSSAAQLDLPAGARVVQARLYVETTVGPDVGRLGVRLDGPGRAFRYTELREGTARVPKLYEAAGGGRVGNSMRQAVWDVTRYVQRRGAGRYTVADIVTEAAHSQLPYASWAIVVAYELDPEAGIDLSTLPPEQAQRFAPRAISWHDGFRMVRSGSLEVTLGGFEVPLDAPTFAKTLHVVAHAERSQADNLLFDGNPLGNNLTPGDTAAPVGVVLGDDPSCNSIVDVQNDTICTLGRPVATKSPGATAFTASGDGTTLASGSGVDVDIIRVPDRYQLAGSTTAVLSVQVTGRDALAPGVLAVSVDLPPAPDTGEPAGEAP